MATKKRIDDKIRLSILNALNKRGSVAPNIRQIQKHTALHKATIKASLDFLHKEGVLEGYGPKINFRSLGYKLEVAEFLQVDLSNKKIFEKFIAVASEDPHLYMLSSVIGSGGVNLILMHFYEDVESFHRETQKRYYESIPGFTHFVKERNIFYITEPHYKLTSRTDSIVELIKKKKGIE